MALTRKLYSGTDYRQALSIAELRAIAKRRVPHFAFEYVDSGAEDEITLKRNQAVFNSIQFVYRVLKDTAQRRQHTTLFDQQIDAPLIIAPTALNNMQCKNGDIALARAAAGANIPFCLSTFSNTRLERLADAVEGRLWMQLYILKNRAMVADIIKRAEQAGYEALVVTVDANVFGFREWDRRNYAAIGQPNLRNLLDIMRHPRWIMDVLVPGGIPRFENVLDFMPAEAQSARAGVAYLPELLSPDIGWDDLKRIRDMWPRKLILKGLVAIEDVETALQAGCDAVALSNHGGRQLDGSVSPMTTLAEARSVAAGKLALLIDSGFRRGADIVKAVATGADAVLLGAATLYGLGAGAEPGARHALKILTGEIDRALGQLGCNSLAELGPHLLRGTTEGQDRIAPDPA